MVETLRALLRDLLFVAQATKQLKGVMHSTDLVDITPHMMVHYCSRCGTDYGEESLKARKPLRQ